MMFTQRSDFCDVCVTYDSWIFSRITTNQRAKKRNITRLKCFFSFAWHGTECHCWRLQYFETSYTFYEMMMMSRKIAEQNMNYFSKIILNSLKTPIKRTYVFSMPVPFYSRPAQMNLCWCNRCQIFWIFTFWCL